MAEQFVVNVVINPAGARRGASQVNQSLTSVGTNASRVGQLVRRAFTFAVLVAGIRSLIKTVGDFQRRMAEVSTLLRTDVVPQTNAISAAARRMAIDFGTSVGDQVSAFYQAISAGAADAAAATTLLDTANRLAIGGVTDVRTGVDALTSVINAYGLEAGAAADISDILFAAMAQGKTTVGELSKEIGAVVSIAATAGVGFDELAAALAAATKNALPLNKATTGIRTAINSIIAPVPQVAQAAKDLGIQFDAAALRADGLVGFLKNVQEVTDGNVEALRRLFPEQRAFAVITALLAGDMKSLEDATAAMNERVGATQRAFELVSNTGVQQLNRAVAALTDILLGVVNVTLNFLSPAFRFFADNVELMRIVLVPFIALLTLYAARVAVTAIATTINMSRVFAAQQLVTVSLTGAMILLNRAILFFAVTPLGRLITAATIVIALIINWREEFRKMGAVGEAIADIIQAIIDTVNTLISVVREAAISLGLLAEETDSVGSAAGTAGKNVQTLAERMQELRDGANDAGTQAEEVGEKFSKFKPLFDDIGSSIFDTIPAFDQMASAGENAASRISSAMSGAVSSIRSVSSSARSSAGPGGTPNLVGTGGGTRIRTGLEGRTLSFDLVPEAFRELADAIGGSIVLDSTVAGVAPGAATTGLLARGKELGVQAPRFDTGTFLGTSTPGITPTFLGPKGSDIARAQTAQFNAFREAVERAETALAAETQARNAVTEQVRQAREGTIEQLARQLAGTTGAGSFGSIDPGIRAMIDQIGTLEGELARTNDLTQRIDLGIRIDQLRKSLDGLTDATTQTVEFLSGNPFEQFRQNVFGAASGAEFTVRGGGSSRDSKLFNLALASGEDVRVRTAAQRRREEGGGGTTIVQNVNFEISTPDADSFRRTQTQLTARTLNQLNKVQART